MDPILIFVVLPLATIIFSIALQKLLKCPILVAGIVFAVFLILTYTVFGTDFLIAAIVYTILAFITAFLTKLFCNLFRRICELERRSSNCDCECKSNCNSNNSGNSNTGTALLSISNAEAIGNNKCGCNSNNNERILVNAEVLPNNERSSATFRGCYRRRWN